VGKKRIFDEAKRLWMQRKRHYSRRFAALAVGGGLCVALTGCGGSDIGKAGEAIADAAKASKGSALDLGKAAKTAGERLKQLSKDDRVEDALQDAFCEGVTSLVNSGSLPDDEAWGGYLTTQVEKQAAGASVKEIEDKVGEFEAAGNLASTNVGAARAYLKACALRF
jgi:hypothetical protein